MSEIIDKAVSKLNEKIGGAFDGSAKVVIEGEGTVMLDSAGARAGDGEADVTLTADADTFRALLDGELDPTSAFMSGRLTIDGEMSQAMKLGNALS
mgnify:CR=1 FL=1